MKNYPLALWFVATMVVGVYGQTEKIQWSTVREQNSNKRPIPNAQVLFTDALPTSSDQNGRFRLVFKGKKAGALVFLVKVQKAGYELVNNKEIEQIKLGEADQLGVDVVLAKVGIVEAAKKQYYKISDQALRESFEREKNKLRLALQASELNTQEYERKNEQLQNDYERQQKELDALAGKFARVNFDDVAPVYKEALLLFKIGKIDEATEKLERLNLTKRTETILAEQHRLASAQEELDRQKAALQKEKRQQIDNLRLLADIYNLKFDIIKTEQKYAELLRLDSTDLDILNDAGIFYRKHHYYAKAEQLFLKVIANPLAEQEAIGNAHGHVGDMNFLTGNLDSALNHYNKYLEIFTILNQKNPQNVIYQSNLAHAYVKQGTIYTNLGDFTQVVPFLEKGLELSKLPHAASPEKLEYKYLLADNYLKLGQAYYDIGNLSKSLITLKEGLRLSNELCTTEPGNINFKNTLTIAHFSLGNVYRQLDDLSASLSHFEKCNGIQKELYTLHPQNVDVKNYLAISYAVLAEVLEILGRYPEALAASEQCNLLEKELYEAYPRNVNFMNGLALSYTNLGSVHQFMMNLPKALQCFEQANVLGRELSKNYPQDVFFKDNVHVSFREIGDLQTRLGDFHKALLAFEQANSVAKELCLAAPQNVLFKHRLSDSYFRLGNTYQSLEDLPKAIASFEQHNVLADELYKSYPETVEYKYEASRSYGKLGLAHLLSSNLSKALTYLERYNVLKKELVESFPKDLSHQDGLAISYSNLGEVHDRLRNLDRASFFFEKALETAKGIVKEAPQEMSYKNSLAESYSEAGSFYRDNAMDFNKAEEYFKNCQALWGELKETDPDNVQIKEQYNNVSQDLTNLKDPLFILQKRLDNEKDTLKMYQLYAELCNALRQQMSINPALKAKLVEALNNRAWYGFFLKEFAEVEADIKEAITLNPEDKYLFSNLAPALLLQGKRELAFAEYRKWKDKPFGEEGLPTYREVFIQDLETFGKAGIIPHKRRADVKASLKILE